MAYKYLNDSNGVCIDFKSYIIPKIKKLYPLYIITTIIVIFVQYYSLKTQGSMLLGLKNYSFVDVALNVFMLGTGIFATRVPFNVPAWFLTPLLVCYILFYVIIGKLRGKGVYGCIIFTLMGAVCLYNKWMYSIFNERMARGVFAFFAGTLIYFFIWNNKDRFNYKNKVSLAILTFCSFIMLKIAGAGIWYLSSVVIFSLVFACVLLFDFVEKILCWCYKLYKPLKELSFPIFLTHYVILTIMSFFDLKYNLQQYFCEWYVFAMYVVFSIALGVVLNQIINLNRNMRARE